MSVHSTVRHGPGEPISTAMAKRAAKAILARSDEQAALRQAA